MLNRLLNFIASNAPVYKALEASYERSENVNRVFEDGVETIYSYVLGIKSPNGSTKKVERMLEEVLDEAFTLDSALTIDPLV